MFHELRIYTLAAGRLEDVVTRIGTDMVPFFERHGLAPRLGQWTAVAGETMRPGWTGFEQRRHGLAICERRPDVVEARRGERAKWAGEHALGDGSSMLLAPPRFASASHS